jgi:hypothetical protein
VVEPYVNPADQEEILFKADLRRNPERTVCFERSRYPWK